MPPPNMKSEIRKELSAIRKQLVITNRDETKETRRINREVAALERERKKMLKSTKLNQCALNKRRLILEGRLA